MKDKDQNKYLKGDTEKRAFIFFTLYKLATSNCVYLLNTNGVIIYETMGASYFSHISHFKYFIFCGTDI